MSHIKVSKSIIQYFFILVLAILIVSCGEEDEPLPQIEKPTILGKWFFTESSSELISKDDDAEIVLPTPNVTNLEWTFLENDSLLTVNPDTLFTSWYHYNYADMRLDIGNGFYDVIKHTEDSLNLRFYVDITVAEFYTYFQLIR
ncbi:MAG: hypothetical protein AB8B73_16080 [Ekhidna sp.]